MVRVCVVGTGRAGMVHAKNFRWRVPHAELVSIVDTHEGRGSEAAAELDLERHHPSLGAALEATEIDAVVITTPTFTHAALAVEAFEAGKHVLCEKPMALTLEECDRMEAAAEKAGVVFQMAFMRRFDPPFLEAKAQIDAGTIGRPLIVRSLTRGPGLPPDWANDPKTSNGMLAEVNSHDFDCVRWLAGGRYTEVFARAAALKEPQLRERFPDFYDTATVSLALDNGAMGMIDGVCPVEYGYDARAEVVGSKGVLFIGAIEGEPATWVTREGGMARRQLLSWRNRFKDAYVAEAEAFVGCIRQERAPEVTADDGRQAVEAVIAANRSIREGRPVAIGKGSSSE